MCYVLAEIGNIIKYIVNFKHLHASTIIHLSAIIAFIKFSVIKLEKL